MLIKVCQAASISYTLHLGVPLPEHKVVETVRPFVRWRTGWYVRKLEWFEPDVILPLPCEASEP